MKLRHILNLYGIYMAKASYSCDMNHLVDYGEFSVEFDEGIYQHYLTQFKNHLLRIGENISDITQMLWDAAAKEKRSWYETELYYIRMSLI